MGGGVTGLPDVDPLLSAGADKISINSAAVRDPRLIEQIAGRYGSQFVVVAIDAGLVEGDWRVFVNGGRIRTPRKLFEWAVEVQERGAGEVLFTSMEHDGTRNGFACGATSWLSKHLKIPVIASGGAGNMDHFREVFTEGGADAALAASIFHYGDIRIAALKSYLSEHSISVRTRTE